MNPPTTQQKIERLTAWAEALESGKYKQGTGQLRKGEEYCCLGVACDVSRVAKWNGGFYDDESGELPPSVASYYGLPRVPRFQVSHREPSAIHLNDNAAYSFPQIAALIREQLIAPLEAAR